MGALSREWPLSAIDKLGDTQIHRYAHQRIGVDYRQALFRLQIIEHFSQSAFCRFGEISVGPHGNDMGRCFGPGPGQFHVLVPRDRRRPENLPPLPKLEY